MWHYLARLGAELAADDTIRVLVVAGAGRSFSAGIDISTFTAPRRADSATAAGAAAAPVRSDVDGILAIQKAFSWLEDAPYPTIAKVQGHAYGAGMQLALACDLRIVADDVRMGLLELNWGLMPDLGGTVWLPRLVGPAKALELMLTGARLPADELLALGVVNRVVRARRARPRPSTSSSPSSLRAPAAWRCGARRPRCAAAGARPPPSACGPRPRPSSSASRRPTSSKPGQAFASGREPRFEGR